MLYDIFAFRISFVSLNTSRLINSGIQRQKPRMFLKTKKILPRAYGMFLTNTEIKVDFYRKTFKNYKKASNFALELPQWISLWKII